MNYILEVLREDKDDLNKIEWVSWVKGDLQNCLGEFFYMQDHPIGGQTALRLTWEGDE